MKQSKALAAASLLATALLHPAAQATPIAGQGTWQTTLQSRDLNGDGVADAFYDTQLNVTWLRNANANGLINWNAATTWASTLNVYGITGWRLPTINDTDVFGCDFSYGGSDCLWNVQTSTGNAVNSELQHLYYVTLGNLACVIEVSNIPGAVCGLTNTANFQNFEMYGYWSGTLYAPSSNNVWIFSTSNNYGGAGLSDYGDKANELYAVAVRSGDVGAASVPVPPTVALMLLAFGAMTGARRKRPA